MDIQNEAMKIHHQYGTSELANYKIQLMCEKYAEEYHRNKLKNLGVIGDVSERVQRIAVYFADKNPTPTKWANDILKYILEGSKHDR